MTTALEKTDPREINLGPITLNESGAAISGGCTFERWYAALQLAQRTQAASQLWIGDLLNFGESRYGHKYEQALSLFTVSHDVLRQWCSVAKRTQATRHVSTWTQLGYSHFREVAPLPADTQVELLEKATAGGHAWTVKDLRQEVAKHREPGSNSRAPKPPQGSENAPERAETDSDSEHVERRLRQLGVALAAYKGHHRVAMENSYWLDLSSCFDDVRAAWLELKHFCEKDTKC